MNTCVKLYSNRLQSEQLDELIIEPFGQDGLRWNEYLMLNLLKFYENGGK